MSEQPGTDEMLLEADSLRLQGAYPFEQTDVTSEAPVAPGPVVSVETMHKLHPTHVPITLVDGQNPNQMFKKPEKTKWTTEEGT